MIKLLIFFTLLLHGMCNAEGITLVPSHENSTRTVHVPNPITFSTQYKSFHHHTAQPQYDLHRMSREQLMWYFTINNYTEGEILSKPLLYMNAAYLTLVKQLPRYPEFVERYYKRYSAYGRLFKIWQTINFRYCKGLAKQFERLHTECKEQQDKDACNTTAKHAYISELKRVENILKDGSHHLRSDNHINARLEAITLSQKKPEGTLRTPHVSNDSINFATRYGITEADITHVTMNHYEYQLHTEFIAHIQNTLTLQTKYVLCEPNIFIDALGNSIALGIKSNYVHNPEWATRWSDFCYEALEIVTGIGEGILLGSYNTINAVMDPVRTLTNIAHGVCMLGSLTARTLGTLAHWHTLIEQGEYDQYGTEIDAISEHLICMATTIKEHATHMPKREIAKQITACGTEWILMEQMFNLGYTLCSNLGHTIKKTIQYLKDEGPAGEFALATTDGILLKASENINSSGGNVKNLVSNTSELLGIAIAEYTTTLQAELEIIRKSLDNKVKGFLECANKYLKPEYEHILGINTISGRNGISKIGGFHHDGMHSFRKSGILEFVDLAKTESGFYKANIFSAGRYIDTKTFFPAHWTRKQVMEKILETCESFIKNGQLPTLTKDGKYLIKHMIENGVEIEIYITKSGHIKTAYPVLK